MRFCFSDQEKLLGGYQALPKIGSGKQRNRGTPGSAKDHYVQRSRYFPGGPNAPIKPTIEGRVVDAGSGRKYVELTSGKVNEPSSKRLLSDLKKAPYLPKIENKGKNSPNRDRHGGNIAVILIL